MTQGLRDALAGLGMFGIGSAALAWLTKSLLTHWLSRDLDAHKVRLEAAGAHEAQLHRHAEGVRRPAEAGDRLWRGSTSTSGATAHWPKQATVQRQMPAVCVPCRSRLKSAQKLATL